MACTADLDNLLANLAQEKDQLGYIRKIEEWKAAGGPPEPPPMTKAQELAMYEAKAKAGKSFDHDEYFRYLELAHDQDPAAEEKTPEDF